MQESSVSSKRISLGAYVALGVFVVALAVRLIGIGWGLKNDLHNASYHPDEPINFGFSRSIEPAVGRFFPDQTVVHFYSYGTLYLTLLRVCSDITSTYTGGPKVKGDGWSWTNPERTDWDWVSRCDLAGRILSAVAGAGTAVVVLLITRRFFGLPAGMAAAAVITFAPGHVINSRYQTVDVLAAFLLACSMYFAMKIAYPMPTKTDEPSYAAPLWKDAMWAGVFAGLSGGTKYTGVLALLSLFVAIGCRRPKDWPKLVAIGAVATLLAFAITTPGAVFDTSNFLSDVAYEMQHTSTGQGLVFVGTPNGFIYQAQNLVFGLGSFVLVILGLFGLIWGAGRKRSWAFVLLAFFIPYYLLIGKAEVKFARYSLPLYIGLACGVGYIAAAGQRRGGISHAAPVLGIMGLGASLIVTADYTRQMIGEDPRDAAAKYLQGVQGHVGFVHTPWFWSPPLFKDSADPLSVIWPIRQQIMQQEAKPPIDFVTAPSGDPTEWSHDLITKLKPERIAMSSFELEPIERLKGRTGFPKAMQGQIDQISKFMDLLQANYDTDRLFPLPPNDPPWFVEDLQYASPTIYIWKRKAGH